MKEFLVISLLIGIFGLCFAYGYDIYKNKPLVHKNGTIEYDFSRQSQFRASRILYKYIQNDLNKTPKELKDFANITPKSVRAFETDLNGDNQNEVIGVVYSTYYWGTSGYSLFIINNEGRNIANANFEPSKLFYVLSSISNGYKDIKLYNSSTFNFKPIIIKFHNNKYTDNEQMNLLEKYLKDFSSYNVSPNVPKMKG